ncbi:hypothetical protein KUTeg_019319 [Tegillarca granosa]|uniref:Methyltransferase-like protein 17, mitochondrial n=1 Tax=Tegillarca granosa TaxID=220873 RepID=A0ABQ9EI50_TEGGR|nr:hypothetical protein KUTeg_019319 [Tegillarca granosa]
MCSMCSLCLRNRFEKTPFRLLLKRLKHTTPENSSPEVVGKTADLHMKTSRTLPRNVVLDPDVASYMQKNDLKPRFHPGIMRLKAVKVPSRLEVAAFQLSQTYGGQRLKKDSERLRNVLDKRLVPTQKSEIDMKTKQITQNLIQKRNLDLDAMTAEEEAKLKKKISKRDPDFIPSSMYNLGSGLGTAIWAVNELWGKNVKEYYYADENKNMHIKNVYFRQFEPSVIENKFPLVICAYMLLELPDKQSRIKVIESLWERTTDYLVLVECPHDMICPKSQLTSKIACTFPVKYIPMQIYKVEEGSCIEKFSYVIMRKRWPAAEKENGWPRFTMELNKPSKCVHCKMCCPDGQFYHMVLTAKKHPKNLFSIAKKSDWGDRLPVVWPEEFIEIKKDTRKRDKYLEKRRLLGLDQNNEDVLEKSEFNLNQDGETLDDSDNSTEQSDDGFESETEIISKYKDVSFNSAVYKKKTLDLKFLMDEQTVENQMELLEDFVTGESLDNIQRNDYENEEVCEESESQQEDNEMLHVGSSTPESENSMNDFENVTDDSFHFHNDHDVEKSRSKGEDAEVISEDKDENVPNISDQNK